MAKAPDSTYDSEAILATGKRLLPHVIKLAGTMDEGPTQDIGAGWVRSGPHVVNLGDGAPHYTMPPAK